MQKLSLSFTQYVNKKYRRTGRLWECRFHSSIVDKEEYLWSVCRYIERNPVRAKIVDKPLLYKWSSANKRYKNDIVESIWDECQREEYENYLNESEKKEEIRVIRKNSYNGRPIGSVKFTNNIANLLKINLNARPKGRPVKSEK